MHTGTKIVIHPVYDDTDTYRGAHVEVGCSKFFYAEMFSMTNDLAAYLRNPDLVRQAYFTYDKYAQVAAVAVPEPPPSMIGGIPQVHEERYMGQGDGPVSPEAVRRGALNAMSSNKKAKAQKSQTSKRRR